MEADGGSIVQCGEDPGPAFLDPYRAGEEVAGPAPARGEQGGASGLLRGLRPVRRRLPHGRREAPEGRSQSGLPAGVLPAGVAVRWWVGAAARFRPEEMVVEVAWTERRGEVYRESRFHGRFMRSASRVRHLKRLGGLLRAASGDLTKEFGLAAGYWAAREKKRLSKRLAPLSPLLPTLLRHPSSRPLPFKSPCACRDPGPLDRRASCFRRQAARIRS